MAYPTTILANTDPSGTSLLTSPDHASLHTTVNDDLTAVENKLGLGAGSAAANQALIGSGAGTSAWTGTWNAATFGTPTITGGTANNQVLGTPNLTGGTLVAYQSTYHTLGSAAISPGTSTVGTLNLGTATRFLVNMPNAAGSVDLAVSNVSANQPFLVEILQGTAGAGTVNWFSTITWLNGGTAPPTQGTTASRKATYGFIATGAATFDGYLVGKGE